MPTSTLFHSTGEHSRESILVGYRSAVTPNSEGISSENGDINRKQNRKTTETYLQIHSLYSARLPNHYPRRRFVLKMAAFATFNFEIKHHVIWKLNWLLVVTAYNLQTSTQTTGFITTGHKNVDIHTFYGQIYGGVLFGHNWKELTTQKQDILIYNVLLTLIRSTQ